jgi:hypothetical protein
MTPVEDVADGLLTLEQAATKQQALDQPSSQSWSLRDSLQRIAAQALLADGLQAARNVGYLAASIVGELTAQWQPNMSYSSEVASHARSAEAREQAGLLRDIVGSRFREAVVPRLVVHTCCEGAIGDIARGAYEHRQMPSRMLDRFRLAMLADALEDAGCTDAELLGHLRSPGPHVRGCWAVDLVLGKE